MVKATFKQDEYESQLSEKIKMMDIHSRTFKDLADQCSYQTQMSTLGEVKTLKLQERASHRSVIQRIAHSRSEANLQHKAETQNIQSLQTEIVQLRTDHANVQALLESSSENQRAESNALKIELKKVLKEFHRSNGRIDMRTNDSQYFGAFQNWI